MFSSVATDFGSWTISFLSATSSSFSLKPFTEPMLDFSTVICWTRMGLWVMLLYVIILSILSENISTFKNYSACYTVYICP